jgi:hypothetical protein
MEIGEWKPRRINCPSAKRPHYPIIPLTYYPIKNALRPWGLASVPALLIFHHAQGNHFGK